ncbi:hypothetical protein CDAR_43551 [Caerostris darwini]|uniref:Uncharacterized protein n=1 Tax=Caerostris darwini TaxID=1538125 RepID=A0AAV4WGQ9_9ARAC|nr:hypothetical protein CDAR_43551 [Caerostris darwini]
MPDWDWFSPSDVSLSFVQPFHSKREEPSNFPLERNISREINKSAGHLWPKIYNSAAGGPKFAIRVSKSIFIEFTLDLGSRFRKKVDCGQSSLPRRLQFPSPL